MRVYGEEGSRGPPADERERVRKGEEEKERGKTGGKGIEKRGREMREDMWRERENKREGRKTDKVALKQFSSERMNRAESPSNRSVISHH